ncbi:MAG: inositol monophosphatase [Cyclobacteriaceae bacterium]|jgi:myo-inositol-1(or 4)-monophosphatase|nr:inositol monophosphatase [Cyclobacteriaceae bacterium]
MNLKDLQENVITLCREVGEFMKAEQATFDLSKIEQKTSFNNLVSYVDKESERRLVTRLSRLLPGSGFMGEEGTNTPSVNGYQWIIDPLDGTTNFLHGLPIYSISIGLAKEDKMILGVVHEVSHGECFYSREGQPAFCNGREIRVSNIRSLSQSLLATGFPYYHTDKKDAYLEIIKSFLEQSHGIRRLGSAAIDLAYVACGRLEGFFEYNLNAWDVAAGGFLVQQAGGTVTDFQGGNNFLFGGELCASGQIHHDMLPIIQAHWGVQQKS